MITIFTGGYGSGKTELSLNYALYLAGHRTFDSAVLLDKPASPAHGVTLVDLDVIKPMFRSRELREPLKDYGVRLVSSLERFEAADLPALSPAIQHIFRRNEGHVVVDLGGDRAGGRVLHRFVDELVEARAELYFVANPFRPFAGSPAEIAAEGEALSRETGLPVTGLVANPHLIDQTIAAHVVSGRAIVAEAAALLNRPVAFTVVREEMLASAREAGCPSPIFPVARFVLPPWEETPVGRAGPPYGRSR